MNDGLMWVDERTNRPRRFNGARGPVRIAQTHSLGARREAAAAFVRDFSILDPSLP